MIGGSRSWLGAALLAVCGVPARVVALAGQKGSYVHFELDVTELKALSKEFTHSESAWARASGQTINELAIKLKVQAPRTLAKSLVVRNPRFVASRFRYTKSRTSKPLTGQSAVMGSIRSMRFSGWREQSEGSSTARERTIALLARKNTITRQALPSARFKPGNRILSHHDIRVRGGGGVREKELAMLAMLKRERSPVPFVLTKVTPFQKGLYKMVGGRVKTLQVWDKKQPKRVPWMQQTIGDTLSDRVVKREFTKQLVVALRARKRLV